MTGLLSNFGLPTFTGWGGDSCARYDMHRTMQAAQQQWALSQQAQFAGFSNATLAEMIGQMQYRPPVNVPQGWADWYACGDELH